MTKTLTTAAIALMISTGAAFAQSGGYFDYNTAPGASDYSHTQLVADGGQIMSGAAVVAFETRSRPTSGSVILVDTNEPPVLFAGGATGGVRAPYGSGQFGTWVAEAN